MASSPSLRFLSLLAEPLHGAYRELCQGLSDFGFPVEFVEYEDWRDGLRQLENQDVDLAAICGLLFVQLKARACRLQPLCSPLLQHPDYGKSPSYWADLMVRSESSIKGLEDIQGKAWLFNEEGSLSGYHAFFAELAKRNLPVEMLENRQARGSHAQALRALAAGEGDFTLTDSTFLDLQENELGSLRRAARFGPYPAPLVVSLSERGLNLPARLSEMPSLPWPFQRFCLVQDGDYDEVRELWNLSVQLRGQGQSFVIDEVLGERKFATLGQARKDQKVLSLIATELLTRLDKEPDRVLLSGPRFHLLKDSDLEHHHYLIEAEGLAKGGMATVGFLSQMKDGVDIQALFDLDAQLLDQLADYEGFLTYSPREYGPGLWANLAVFRDVKSRDHWAKNSTHLRGIKELGASSYDNVRLHLGHWLDTSQEIEWCCTRYLHYGDSELWRGVRTF